MIKVIIQGLGPIGQSTAKLVLDDPEMELVGCIDINPNFVGKDLGELLERENLGLKIIDDINKVFNLKPDVLILATSSNLDKIKSSLRAAIENGINVVSPAEELFYPEFIDNEMAVEVNELAKKSNVRIIGGAVNPGCLMDSFPLHIFKENFDELISMKICRWDDTSERRAPLLSKTGAGLSVEDFKLLNCEGKLGHVGLKMSAVYLAEKIGLKNYSVEFRREQMVAKEKLKPVNGREIELGGVTGIKETCLVIMGDEVKITLDLRMYVGARNKNYVDITGIKEGVLFDKLVDYSEIVNGDVSTSRILKNMVKNVVNGEFGLNSIGYVPDPRVLLRK
jgi:2,4-diaminopentanoate dehydrogenase